MKNKKLQIILLVILLVAVLVGGIYFLTRSEDMTHWRISEIRRTHQNRTVQI